MVITSWLLVSGRYGIGERPGLKKEVGKMDIGDRLGRSRREI